MSHTTRSNMEVYYLPDNVRGTPPLSAPPLCVGGFGLCNSSLGGWFRAFVISSHAPTEVVATQPIFDHVKLRLFPRLVTSGGPLPER